MGGIRGEWAVNAGVCMPGVVGLMFLIHLSVIWCLTGWPCNTDVVLPALRASFLAFLPSYGVVETGREGSVKCWSSDSVGLQGLLHYGRKRSTVCIIELKIFPVTWDSDT